jgi:hypothetical protein
MFRLAIALLLLLPAITRAQGNPIAHFNDEAYWQQCPMVRQLPASPIKASDTAIVVVSNRKPSNDALRYMSETRDGDTLRYYFVYSRGGRWNVLQVASLEKAIQYMPDKSRDWVMYTEGMGKLFTTDLYRGMSMAGQYGVNVILFDYPSITTTKKSLGNYFFAIGNARTAYKDFTPAFEDVKRLKEAGKLGTGNISMFYHSMGNHVIRQMVKHNKIDKLNGDVWISNVILNAACVPRRGHKRWINNISFAKGIYINYNQDDLTLKMAYLAGKKIQLGNKPVRNISSKAHYINFNTLCGSGHSNFLSLAGREPAKPAALQYYRTILHGQTPDMKDAKLFGVSSFKKIGVELNP